MAGDSAKSWKRAVPVLTMALAVTLVAMLFASQCASAAIGPKNVRGVVRDVDGSLVKDMPVTVNIRYAGNDTIRATLTNTTDENGYFVVTFGDSQWDTGDRIQVIATHGAHQESNSTIATEFPFQWCNITFPYAIPEFGSLLGFAIAGGLIAVVAMFFLVSKRKK